jgi:hypothetical protein
MRKLLANRWETPDGVILHSKYTHDYQTHIDKKGNFYMVDGGNNYIRTSNSWLMKDLCIYDDGTFKTQREWCTWGRRNGELVEHIPIKDLDFNHIYAILATQKHISKEYRRLFEDELLHRMGEKVE